MHVVESKNQAKKLISTALIFFFIFVIFQGGVFKSVKAALVPVKIEAESAKLTSGAVFVRKYKNFTGAGYVALPAKKPLAKVTFTTNAEKIGNYDVTVRYSNGNKVAKKLAIYKNDKYFKTITFAKTGSFSAWKTLVCTLRLKSGTNTIAFKSKDNTSGFIDYISLIPVEMYSLEVNFETKYQTIEGFGGFGGNDSSSTFYNQKYVDDTYDDLGATIYRGEVATDFQSNNDGSDVNTINASSFNQNGMFKKWKDYFLALQAKGPCKIFLTPWTPPAWMKTNNDLENGGSLKPEYYQHFAKYCAAYVKLMEAAGVHIYAFNIQNEPNFVEPYVSCVYTFEEYAAVTSIVAARFKKEGLTVKMLGPEDVSDSNRISQYVFAFDYAGKMNDLGVIGVHGYSNDGVHPSGAEAFWSTTYSLAKEYNKPVWMTETSGFTNQWDSVLNLAATMQTALSVGRLNAWVWWRLSDNLYGRNETEGLMKNMVATPKYYVSKNFYRYIRPGSVRYACSSPYADLKVTAYKNPTDMKITILIVNEANVSRTISIGAINGGTIPYQFNVFRTSATENCVSSGSANSSSLVIPASCVTTLQANY